MLLPSGQHRLLLQLNNPNSLIMVQKSTSPVWTLDYFCLYQTPFLLCGSCSITVKQHYMYYLSTVVVKLRMSSSRCHVPPFINLYICAELQQFHGVRRFELERSCCFSALLLDEERGRLFVGAKNFLLSLSLDNIAKQEHKVGQKHHQLKKNVF